MTTETSIQCDCPHCGRVCGFKADFAGRIARCLNCNTRFVIPQRTGLPAVPCPVAAAEPLPGFYASVFKGGLKAFTRLDSAVGLVFCAALVTAHFLLGNVDLSVTLPGFRLLMIVGWGVTFIAFGGFSWYSMEVIAAAQLGLNSLPPVEPGAGLEFLWLAVKSCYLFFVSLVVALLPASIISAVVESLGGELGQFYYVIAAVCLLLWPMSLAMIATELPIWRIFRYDLIVAAVAKTFVPYLLTAIITLTAFALIGLGIGSFATREGMTLAAGIGWLVLRLAGAMLFLFAMRTIGVYGLHYAEVYPRLWATPASHHPTAR